MWKWLWENVSKWWCLNCLKISESLPGQHSVEEIIYSRRGQRVCLLCTSIALRQRLRGALVCLCVHACVHVSVCACVWCFGKKATSTHSLPSQGSSRDPWPCFQIMYWAETDCLHLPVLCLAAIPILLPPDHLTALVAWSVSGQSSFLLLPLRGCWLLICMASNTWFGGHLWVSPKMTFPEQWDSFVSQMVILTPSWNYLVNYFILFFIFLCIQRHNLDIHILATKETILLGQRDNNSGIQAQRTGSNKAGTTDWLYRLGQSDFLVFKTVAGLVLGALWDTVPLAFSLSREKIFGLTWKRSHYRYRYWAETVKIASFSKNILVKGNQFNRNPAVGVRLAFSINVLIMVEL